jgi:hypothetical protein
MKTVTLDVRSPEAAAQDFVRAWKTGRARRSARISFASAELLWKVLSALALLQAGVLDRTDAGRLVFPYDSVKVEFMLQAA